MSLRWRYHDGDGAETTGPDVEFDDQPDAEEWLTAHWPELLDDRIEAVTLLDGEDELYGPMGLRPA